MHPVWRQHTAYNIQMSMFNKILRIFFLVVVFSYTTKAQDVAHKKVFYRLGFAPVLSFYKNNPYHTSSNTASPAYNFSFLTEIRINKRVAFLTGLEYLLHGLNFNSYYFPDGATRVYNNNLDFRYSVFMNEINLPLLMRFNPHGEEKNHFSPYASFGYDFRYVLLTHLAVKSNLDGSQPFDGFTKVSFEHPFIYPRGSSFIAFNAGLQKNFLSNHKALFFELNFKYSLTRFLIQESFTPGSLYIRNFHLAFTLGCKI